MLFFVIMWQYGVSSMVSHHLVFAGFAGIVYLASTHRLGLGLLLIIWTAQGQSSDYASFKKLWHALRSLSTFGKDLFDCGTWGLFSKILSKSKK